MIAHRTGFAMNLLGDVALASGAQTPEASIAMLQQWSGSRAKFRAALDPATGLGDVYRQEMTTMAGLGTGLGMGPTRMMEVALRSRQTLESYYGPGMAGTETGRAIGRAAVRNVALQAHRMQAAGGRTLSNDDMLDLEREENIRMVQ